LTHYTLHPDISDPRHCCHNHVPNENHLHRSFYRMADHYHNLTYHNYAVQSHKAMAKMLVHHKSISDIQHHYKGVQLLRLHDATYHWLGILDGLRCCMTILNSGYKLKIHL